MDTFYFVVALSGVLIFVVSNLYSQYAESRAQILNDFGLSDQTGKPYG